MHCTKNRPFGHSLFDSKVILFNPFYTSNFPLKRGENGTRSYKSNGKDIVFDSSIIML